MVNWWETLLNLILALLNRDPAEAQRRRALRRLQEAVKNSAPPLYRPSSGQVQPGLADHLLVLARTLQPFERLLDRTLRAEDPHLGERFLDSVIEARLPEVWRTKAERLCYGAMRERLSAAVDAREEWRRLDGELLELSRLSSSPSFRQLEEALAGLKALNDLSRYDFERLLREFDPQFSMTAPAPRSFQAVEGDQILPHLLDLHFVLASVSVTPDLQEDLGRLLERLEGGRSEESRAALHQSLVRLQKSLDLVSVPLLADLLRVLQGDPSFQPAVDREKTSYGEAWMSRLDLRYRLARDRILREDREREVAGLVRDLFQGAEISGVAGYGEEISRTLTENGFPALRWVRPLGILAAFIRLRFEQGPRELIKKLLVEGQYDDRSFENTLSGTFYGCAGLGEQIDQFSESMSGEDHISSGSIGHYLEQHNQGKAVTAVLNKLVETVDQRAGRLVEDGAKLFYGLAGLLTEVLAALRQTEPARIVNLRSIGGSGNREYLMGLTRSLGEVRTLAEILGAFTVLRQIPGAP